MAKIIGDRIHQHCITKTDDFDCTLSVSACLNATHSIGDNPLDDPVVRSSLQQAKLSDRELIDMTVKELNKRVAHCPADVVNKLKRCRRTLKNRGYAKNCRIKRIAGIRQMQQMLEQKNQEIEELKRQLRSLQLPSYLAPPTAVAVTKVDGGTPSAYGQQNQLPSDGNNNYQQQQQQHWQQREPMEQVNCRQQQHCFRALQEAEMGYANLLNDPLEHICRLEQQNQMIDEKQPINEMIMEPPTNYVEWAPTIGPF